MRAKRTAVGLGRLTRGGWFDWQIQDCRGGFPLGLLFSQYLAEVFGC